MLVQRIGESIGESEARFPITPPSISRWERRHFPGIEERVNDLPISRIPADQEHARTRGKRSGHGRSRGLRRYLISFTRQ